MMKKSITVEQAKALQNILVYALETFEQTCQGVADRAFRQWDIRQRGHNEELQQLQLINGIEVRSMKCGEIGVIVNGPFKGEVIYRNVAGWHSLTADRYWSSGFSTDYDGYVPDFDVRLLRVGATLTIEA